MRLLSPGLEQFHHGLVKQLILLVNADWMFYVLERGIQFSWKSKKTLTPEQQQLVLAAVA